MDMALYLVVILSVMFVHFKHSHGLQRRNCNGAYLCRHQGASNWTMYIDKNKLCDGIPQCPCGDDEEMCPIKVVDTCSRFTNTSNLTNVALGKTVTMSSQYIDEYNMGNSDGSLLVDGNRNGIYPCAHTKGDELNPYMMVDLEDNYNVHSLNVLNRLDCCSERLYNLKIELGQTTETMRTYVFHNDVVGDECTFDLDHITVARYVRLSVVGRTSLTICELAVYIVIYRHIRLTRQKLDWRPG